MGTSGGAAAARISDAAVRAKTGKGWAEWLAVLDAAGAMKMGHKGIVAHLKEHHGVEPWWQQMVTVAYEQERGLREVHQMPQGYQISISKTLNAPVAELYEAWQQVARRRRWLPEAALRVRQAAPGRSLRITWPDGVTSVEVSFSTRGEGKGQVTVQHSRLADAAEAERMKAYWDRALGRLKESLATRAAL